MLLRSLVILAISDTDRGDGHPLGTGNRRSASGVVIRDHRRGGDGWGRAGRSAPGNPGLLG